MSELVDLLEQMVADQARLLMRVAEVERKMDNSVRHGKVTDVDTKKQLARIEIGEKDGKPLKSAWVPYGQIAGDYKSHRPPTKGQQMTMFAPNGEIRQAMLLPFTWSDDNKSPSEKEDEHVVTYGKLKIVEKAENYSITIDKASLNISKDTITLKVDGSEFEIKGSTINLKSSSIFLVGPSHIGVEAKNEAGVLKIKLIDDSPAKQVSSKP